jgi:hypothetical protein
VVAVGEVLDVGDALELLEPTRSLIFSITFSGPTPYGSSVTTMPLRRGRHVLDGRARRAAS